ncbi:hypothetical protein LSM04_006728 [Trypanosoma melophagium]|uniref:uncharacterized protein n=1 Tax=Trypanosoma melophagium TaxID=715481 RepID=UPI003519DD50|nr:hypothetical protein LSM04_006728 [Trypanosoma melophagium]
MIVASLRGTCVTPIAFEPNTKAEENACVHKHTRAYAQTGAGRDGKGWSTLCGHLFALTAAPLLHQRDLSPPATRSWRCGRDDERTKKGISCRAAGLRARSADMKRFDLLQSIPFSR